MTSELAIVPAPLRCELPPEAPFRLSSATVLSGEFAGLLGEELARRTGVRPGVGEGGEVTLRVSGEGAAESYRIRVDDARVAVEAADRAGLRHAVWTLVQAVTLDGSQWVWPAAVIEDAPRLRYRGLMLDVARRFFDVATVKQIIDRAARLKLNVLHLHLSDDQGWRLEILSRPELTAVASASAALGGQGGFYTQAEYADIVSYAASYDMVVVPEIDLPGHTHCVGVAYPDLVDEPVLTDEMLAVVRRYGGGVPVKGQPCDCIAVGFSSLRIHHEPTYEFLRDVLGEVAALTPGPWLHIGGDECLGTAPEDFAFFMSRVTGLVAELGKTPVAWHEAGAAPHLAPGTVGQYWGLRDPEPAVVDRARTFVEGGGQLVLSPGDAVYLDMKYDASTPLGLEWAGPVSVAKSYDWDPATLIPGVSEADVLGVEAAVWTETIATTAQFDEMAFPRLASAAEVAWSPAPGESPWRTWGSFARRLGAQAPLWEAQGIGFFRSPEIDWQDGQRVATDRG